MITEERIKELLRPIIAQLFEWSVRVRRPSYGTIEGFVQSTFKSTLYTVAAEARRGGIESVKLNSIVRITKHKERCSKSGYSLGEFTEGLEVGIKVITEEAERLKEQG